MITVNCPKCGAQADIDEKHEESVVCKHCKTVITLEKAAPEKYKELMEAREKQEQRYKNILKDYEGGNDAPLKNAMHKVISNTDNNDFNINRWFDFIFDAVNIGIKKKDTTNLEILKAHARHFDDAYSDYNAGDRRLYDSLVFLHPEILNDSEWKEEFEKASVSKADVTLLQNNILKCVKEKKEPKLLVSVLNVLSGSQEEFRNIGEEFLNSILDDEDIAKILSVSFFKKARGGNFAKKLKKYVSSTFKDSEVILKDTLVWNNAEKVKKQRKTQGIVIVSSVLAVAAAAVLVFFLFKNAMLKDSIKLEKPEGKSIIDMVYSENPELSGYTVIYEERDGTVVRVPVTPDMITGYDKEKIGTQDAKITYKGKIFDVKIEVRPYKLLKTTASISENKLVWERVANAEEYHVYLFKNSTYAGEAKYATIDDKAGNAALVFDLAAVNSMGTNFYACVVAGSTSEKYQDSDKSDIVEVKKLSAPSGVTYDKESGKLKWNAVEGANQYEVRRDGELLPTVSTNEISLTLNLGDNAITITAFPTEASVIMSVTNATIHKLSPVQSIYYEGNNLKWNADSQSNLYNIYRDGELVAEKHSGKAYDVSAWPQGVYTVNIEVAANSLEKVTSERIEQKVHVGTRLTVSAGRVDWTLLGGTSYDIYVNGNKFEDSSTTEKFKDIAALVPAAGEYKIYVVVDDTGISETIIVKKLHAPSLAVQSQVLKVNGLADNNEFKVDGTVFSGEYGDILDTLTVAKEYVITAVNKAVGDNEIDSDVATITVKRLAAPVISVVSGELYVAGGASVIWYVDGVKNSIVTADGNTHKVVAKTAASADNELDSLDSNELTVTKLVAPVIEYQKNPERKLICTPETVVGGRLQYYNNGATWEVNLNNLTGQNVITARFMSTAENVINSDFSGEITIVANEVKLELHRNANKVTAALSNGAEGLKCDITFTWYNGTSQAGTRTWSNLEFTGKTFNQAQSVPSSATRIVVTVTIHGSDEPITKEIP